MALPRPGVRITAFQKNAFQNNAFQIGGGAGWFDEWVDKPWHCPDHWYPDDIDFIMAEQKAGKSRYRRLPAPKWLLQQMQQAETEDWYEDHLRALLARRKKKK